jgi:hypothetical protein
LRGLPDGLYGATRVDVAAAASRGKMSCRKHGRNGRVSTDPEVTYMTDQIRQAVWDCRHGNVAAVRERAALVTERLHQRS